MRTQGLSAAFAAVLLCCSSFSGSNTDPPPPTSNDAGDGRDSGTVGTDGGLVCDSKPVDLENDPKNCGRCGHDCLGGACQNGSCKAFTVLEGLTRPDELALDDDSLYFAADTSPSEQAVHRVARVGPVSPVAILAGLENIDSVEVVSSILYATETHTTTGPTARRIHACDAPGGGQPQVIFEMSPAPSTYTPLARLADGVAWGVGGTATGTIGRASGKTRDQSVHTDTSCPPTLLARGTSWAFVCMSGAATVHLCLDETCAGANSKTSVFDAPVTSLVGYGDLVIASTAKQLALVKADGTRSALIPSSSVFTRAGDSLIFVDSAGVLSECPLADCGKPYPLATAQPAHIVADAQAVYWSEGTSIRGVARR